MENILKEIDKLSIDEIDLLSEKLKERSWEINYKYFKSEILTKISQEQYNDFKVRINKIRTYSKEVMIPKSFEINCGFYYYKGKIEFEVNMYGGGENSDMKIINSTTILEEERKNLQEEINKIKNELTILDINYASFVGKVIEELDDDKDNIRSIIE